MRAWMAPWLLLALPILGAGLSVFLKASLPRMKTVALVTTVASLCSVIGSALVLGEPASGVPFSACCRWRPACRCSASPCTATQVQPGP